MGNRTFRSAVGALAAAGLALVAWPASPADARSRIVGGSAAPPGSWPAIVAVVPHGTGNYLSAFCGGTLIDPAWVLSAAHCFEAKSSDQPGEVDVGVGVTNLASDPGQRIGVTAIVRHPAFDKNSLVNDVALLHLAAPAALGPAVTPMDLVSPPRPELWDAGSPAEIAGWGETGGGLATSLREASISMISDTTCASLLSGFSPGSMVCAGVLAGGIDSCQGDSGGPLTVLDGGGRVLVGAVSWGIGCAQPDKPGVYTRLDALRGFLFGPTGLNRAPPAAPASVSGAPGVRSATVTWTPPASDGGRAIAGYGVRIIHNGVPESLLTFPGSATQGIVGDLVPGHTYAFTVLAANAAGLGPASPVSGPVVPAPPAPTLTTPPAVTGVPRVGRRLQASPGTWTDLGSTSLQWQACDATGASCVDIPSATGPSFTPMRGQVGKRLRVQVTARNAGGAAQATATAPGVVLPVFAIRVLRAARSAQKAGGRIRLTARVRIEAGVRIWVRVLDHRLRPRVLNRALSRIDGRRPRPAGARAFTHIVRAGGVVDLRIVAPGSARAALRTGRLVLVATDSRGERAVLRRAFRARF